MSKRHISALALSIGIVGFGPATATPSTQDRAEEPQATEAHHRERCTNRSLQGNFATMVEGYFLAGAAQVPLRSVGLTHFDGRGNVSQVDHAVVDGMPPPVDWSPATGTYTVNPDCTGQSELNIPGNPLSPLNIRFVIADDGNLLLSVLSEPGTAITSKSTRLSSR
jgi:hypothetical protein